MSGGIGISKVFSTINQCRRYIEANGFWRKVQIKYAKNIVEESKDKKNRVDQFEDTTGNNACTLGYHHHQHQN